VPPTGFVDLYGGTNGYPIIPLIRSARIARVAVIPSDPWYLSYGDGGTVCTPDLEMEMWAVARTSAAGYPYKVSLVYMSGNLYAFTQMRVVTPFYLFSPNYS